LVGFNYFNSKKVEAAVKDKNTNIIVYCSIGVRSEQIGEKLKN
jgi:rhodanese-related sulfurtransferase